LRRAVARSGWSTRHVLGAAGTWRAGDTGTCRQLTFRVNLVWGGYRLSPVVGRLSPPPLSRKDSGAGERTLLTRTPDAKLLPLPRSSHVRKWLPRGNQGDPC